MPHQRPWMRSVAYLRRAERAGIGHTIAFSAFHGDYAEANREVARIVARNRMRLTGFAMIHPVRDAGRVKDMVREAVQEYRFRGVKVHGHEAMPTREVCEAVQSFKVPLLVDVAGKAHVVDMFAPQYPDVNFIIAHLGSFADDWRAHERIVEQLARYPNVYADTSGVRRFDYLVRAVKRAGPHKLLFGSDGPWLHPGVELHKIKLLGLPQREEALILGQTARRLIFTPGAAASLRAASASRPRDRRSGLPIALHRLHPAEF